MGTNGGRRNRGRSAYPARYSAAGLVRRGLTAQPWPPAWRPQPMKDSYDVVIVGAGVHGLAAAYYLAANHGITDVAVLDKGYLGGGGSGRNTAILRSNYLTPEGVRFYDRSVKLYQRLATDLDYNVMFSQRGHLTLAHSDASLRTMRWRAEANKVEGVESEVIGPAEVKRLAPFLDVSAAARYPILGALWHPPGGIIRHDAVVWGYARGAAARGVHIHQHTEVTGIDVAGGRVRGVRTSNGDIATPVVLNATAGWSTPISDMARGTMPVTAHPPHTALPPAGRRHRAGEAVPVHRHRVWHAARLHQPDRPGRARVRRQRGPLHVVLDARLARVHRGPGRARARAHARPDQGQAAAAVGGPVRHDPRFLADHGPDTGRRLPRRRGLGHLRVQGRPGVGGGHGAVHRLRPDPRDHRRLRPGTVRRGRPGGREGRGRRRPLMRKGPHDSPALSLVRPAAGDRVRPCRRG